MELDRGMTVHFMDGSKVSLTFPKQVKHDESIVSRIEEALEKQHLLVEADGTLMVIPFNNIKYIQAYPLPPNLPLYAIRQAAISG